jgi:glyoxalase family protein
MLQALLQPAAYARSTRAERNTYVNTAVYGIHHVTAIAGDPQENVDFYVGALGMRLVKRSVNQDVPDTYHLFYADGAGTPGTDLTFFPWPQMEQARLGIGFVVEVPLAVPQGSLAYWQERFAQQSVAVGAMETRFGEPVLPFTDPHGQPLALVETADERPFVPWAGSAVPPEHQVRGMHAVRLWERDLAPTARLLTDVLGFQHVGTENGWQRYGVAGGTSGTLIELKAVPDARRGQWGTGGVHHVAWRVQDSAEQLDLRNVLVQAGLRPTGQIDRFWFESVYFKEPGGVLFELATDGPGFARDEAQAHLGEQLILPPWLERERAAIEAALPPLRMPHTRA